ncbi:MAG: hypothetical protein U0229_06275 [Anaeromyxobacter sp.]
MPAGSPRQVLWLRPDAVGDNLIALPMLPHVARRYPGARITVVCQEVVAPLYEACPHVSAVVAFRRGPALADEAYRAALFARVAAAGADLCLHSVHSREPLGDLLAHASGAGEVVGFGGDTTNMTAEEHARLDRVYTRLLPPEPHDRPEVDRHVAFLRALGCEVAGLEPALWLPPSAEAEADATLARLGLRAGEAIAVFPGTTAATRRYPRLGEALRPLAAEGIPLVVLGTEAERPLGDAVLREAGGRGVNLSEGQPILSTAALMRRTRLAVGVESGLAQLAAAAGVPHVVAQGGAFFGRFLLTGPLTSVAALPLDCYGCAQACRHPRHHCLTDLDPAVVTAAIRAALGGPSARPRLHVQGWFSGSAHPERGPAAGGPESREPRLDLSRALALSARAELHTEEPAGAPGAATPGGKTVARTTVFCAVWHKDPQRVERLRGHQASLDAQLAPVERIYVFDGNDTPPDWLKGKVVVSREPLGLYEAWNVALPLVRTEFVMNLNLDDRLNPEAVDLYEHALDAGADLVGGDWRICFTQEEADTPEPCAPADALPMVTEWPPRPGRKARLGSGTRTPGTFGPACAWRTALHGQIARYPWQFGDRTPIRVIADAVWWMLLEKTGKKLRRMPIIVGRYLSDPVNQAEFRSPADAEHEKLARGGIELV